MKFVTFVSRPAGLSRSEFQTWFTDVYAPDIGGLAGIRGCLVRETHGSPDPADEAEAERPVNNFEPYDIVMETWFSSTEDFRREARPLEVRLREKSCRYISYRVTPRLQKDPRIAEAGSRGARPEVTVIFSFTWASGLSAEQGARYWDEHTAIALRAQPAMTKYEQNLVEEVISWTAGTRAIDAYGDFSFRTMHDLMTKFIAADEEIQDAVRWNGKYQVAFLGDARSFIPQSG